MTHIEHRYEERVDEFTVRSWRDGTEFMTHGLLIDRPEWLPRILDVAKVGEEIYWIATPPPSCLLWFTTDEARNLIEFTTQGESCTNT